MVRLLILALVVVLVVWLLLGRSRKRAADGAAPRSKQPTAFAVCAHCGLHLPMHDAVLDGQTAYCSDAHRLAGPRERD